MTVIYDPGHARRWLASQLEGTDALTDEQVSEGAWLLATTMDANRNVAECCKEDVREAVARSLECVARWEGFKLRHGLTSHRFAG